MKYLPIFRTLRDVQDTWETQTNVNEAKAEEYLDDHTCHTE